MPAQKRPKNDEAVSTAVMDHLQGLAVRAVLEKNQTPNIVALILELPLARILEWVVPQKPETDAKPVSDNAVNPAPAVALPSSAVFTPAEERSVNISSSPLNIESWLQNTVLNSTPIDHGQNAARWTPALLGQLLQQSAGFQLEESEIGLLLKKLGIPLENALPHASGKTCEEGEQPMTGNPDAPSSTQYEISASFASYAEFQEWCQAHPEAFNQATLTGALDQIRSTGIDNVFDGEHLSSQQLAIGPNLRESLLCNGINSRLRAVLLELLSTQTAMGLFDNQIRVYAPEALTPLALLLRGRYPFFIGSEYLPTESEQQLYFPIPHQDLQALTFPNNAFHIVVSNEVFEHLPHLDKALAEIHRVLKTGGILIATFPFAFASAHSIVKARLNQSQEIEYLMEPEFHGNPVAPEQGALVYEIPGWDILDRARQAGFSFAEIRLRMSARHGVLAEGINGILIMAAGK